MCPPKCRVPTGAPSTEAGASDRRSQAASVGRKTHSLLHLIRLRLLRVRLAITALLLAPIVARSARAADVDFVNEVLIPQSVDYHEPGFEFGADSRVDRDYRVQGWFTPEVEYGITHNWLAEGTASFINRGRGFEFGTWHAESRYLALTQPRWPVSLGVAAEYEVSTSAAKHLSLERVVAGRAIVSRQFGHGVLAAANWGWSRRLRPIVPLLPARDMPLFGLGVRLPEGAPLEIGFEYRHETLDHLTQFGPELRIHLPNRSLLRLGGFAGKGSRLYRFIGRAVLEAEL